VIYEPWLGALGESALPLLFGPGVTVGEVAEMPVSEQQRTEVSAGNQAAQAMLEQAEAAVKLARTNVGYHTLRSPIDGIVTNAPDNAGILVGAGTPTFVIEDLSALRLKGTADDGPEALREAILERAEDPRDFSAFRTGPLPHAERYPVDPDPAETAQRRLGDFVAQTEAGVRREVP